MCQFGSFRKQMLRQCSQCIVAYWGGGWMLMEGKTGSRIRQAEPSDHGAELTLKEGD